MSENDGMMLRRDEPLGRSAVDAIHQGDVATLKRLLDENPGLASARIGGAPDACQTDKRHTLLHVATDWPGHFPNAAASVAVLVEAGADVNARFTGKHTETPLHWAASSDDIEVLDALLDLGADIDATGSVIDGGPPLADAVAFGQWKAARRLIERGAQANLWQAAALGLMEKVQHLCPGSTVLAPHEITKAFWCACHGGQRAPAKYLLERGAEINWVGFDKLTPLDAALRSEATEVANWLRAHGAKSIQELG